MPKVKTKKSLAKRFKITKTGKVMYRHNFNRHLKSGKSKTKRRAKKKAVVMETYFAKKIRKSLGIKLRIRKDNTNYGTR